MTCVVEPRKTVRSTMPGSRLAPVSPASASSTHSGRMTARPGPAS